MPIKGYNVATIRGEAYELARRQARREGISIAGLVAKAIERYVNRALEREETIRTLLKVYAELEERRSINL